MHTQGSGSSNRRSGFALGMGAVLIVVGLVLISWAFIPLEGTKTRTISVVPDVICPPNGTNNVGLWVLMKCSFWYRGELDVYLHWSPDLSPHQQGYNLGFVLMNQSWFDQFKATREPYTVILADHHDSLAEFPLRTPGNYYLVLLNMGPIDQEYNVTVRYSVTGVHLVSFVPGVAVLLLACPILFYARRLKGKGFEGTGRSRFHLIHQPVLRR